MLAQRQALCIRYIESKRSTIQNIDCAFYHKCNGHIKKMFRFDLYGNETISMVALELYIDIHIKFIWNHPGQKCID